MDIKKLYSDIANSCVEDLTSNYTKNDEVNETLEVEVEGGLAIVNYIAFYSENPWIRIESVEVIDNDGYEMDVKIDYNKINTYAESFLN